MEKLTYKIRFITPAFLGNAEQKGQWRTPPFKALLRQWWRVVYAAEHGFDVDIEAMRREEGLLFGNAWLSHKEGNREVADHRKSLVWMRLTMARGHHHETWIKGTQNGVSPMRTNISTSYAWFGLVRRGAGQPDLTGIKSNTTEGERILRISAPDEHVSHIEDAMRLIDSLGHAGRRSRGGWGSLRVVDAKPFTAAEMARYAQPLQNCLNNDWPMSLCSDSKGLCLWESRRTFASWDEAMCVLAEERRNVRTALKLVDGRDLRFALGFAGEKGRMASPLRWKVYEGESNKLVIRVFAMPHKFSADIGMALNNDKLSVAWKVVCEALDQSKLFWSRTQDGGREQ